eukprot:1159874-Pelagomonas_calceolata.AAC.10
MHQKPPNFGILGNEFCWSCMPGGRVDGGLAGSGQALPSKDFPKLSTAPATASHAPLTGLLGNLFWEGSQSFRLGGVLGGPGQQV